MKKLILATAIALSFGTAQAGNDKDTGEVCQGSTCNGGAATTQGQAQGQAQLQGQLQGQAQGQSSRNRNTNRNDNRSQSASTSVSNTNTSATVGLTTSTTVNNNAAAAPSDVTVRNTPDAFAVAPAPSATCIVTGGIGLSVPGFGGGVSGGQVDEGCVARENARLLMVLDATAAIRVLCDADARVARSVKGCEDLAAKHAADSARKASAPGPYTAGQ